MQIKGKRVIAIHIPVVQAVVEEPEVSFPKVANNLHDPLARGVFLWRLCAKEEEQTFPQEKQRTGIIILIRKWSRAMDRDVELSRIGVGRGSGGPRQLFSVQVKNSRIRDVAKFFRYLIGPGNFFGGDCLLHHKVVEKFSSGCVCRLRSRAKERCQQHCLRRKHCLKRPVYGTKGAGLETLSEAKMTATPDSKRRDTRPPKRKRDPTEVERHMKARQKRMKNQNNETVGLLDSPKTPKASKSQKSLTDAEESVQNGVTPSRALVHQPTTASQLKAQDVLGAGWAVSKPLGGRIEDIDPLLSGDERFEHSQWIASPMLMFLLTRS